jgi:predicted ABC-type ATPase
LPRLTIIAGPNGAGKSTFSESLLQEQGIEAFDFDKEFHATWKLFSYDPAVEHGVRESIGEKFDNAKQDAIIRKTNFAFETNYHIPTIREIVIEFKAAGFETELIFIALISPSHAIERVKNRVANKGHSVDIHTIRERFEKGLELLDNSFSDYDSFTLFMSKDMDMEALVHIEDVRRNVITINREMSSSLQTKLPRLCNYLKTK